MFIPLTINDAELEKSGKNILLAGDTAGIFYLLSAVSCIPVNIFLADTGIKKPLREFPCHRETGKDRANVYYDFFDGRIGAGIVRRMDAVFTAGNIEYITDACKMYNVPLSVLNIDETGAHYTDAIGHILLTADNIAIKRPRKKPIKVIRSECSAWDGVNCLLSPTDSIVYNNTVIHYENDNRRLIELGVPELEILTVEHSPTGRHIVELTGDLNRVFDGLMVE